MSTITPSTLTSMRSIHRYLKDSRSSKGIKHQKKTMKAVQLHSSGWLLRLKKRKKMTMVVLQSKLNKPKLSSFKMRCMNK